MTLFLTVFTIGIAIGSLLCSRILGGRISAGTVPWGALGIALFSIDLWWASPPAAAEAGTLLGLRPFLSSPAHWRILIDLLGIAVSGGIFIVPLYVLLQAASARAQRARAIAANNVINAAAMVIAAVATMALIAVGVSVPGLFLLTGGATPDRRRLVLAAATEVGIGADQIRGRQEMTAIANDPLPAFRLNGKVAVITGGGSGIGRATAAALAGVGAAVAVIDIDPVRAAAVAEEIGALGRPVSSHAADVTDEKSVDAAIDAVASRHGGIDILVNSAGIGIRRAAVELPLAEWDKVVAVNLTGVFLCSRAAARQMMRRGGGAIVNLASIMGFSGGGIYPNVSYQATKGAVVNMTRALAVEWASSGIRVNAVAPTWVRTNLTAPLLDQPGVMERIAGTDPNGTAGDAGGDRARDPLPRKPGGGDGHRSHARRRRRLSGSVTRARTRLGRNASASRSAVANSSSADDELTPERPTTSTPARRNSSAARGKCVLSVTRITARQPCRRNNRAVSRALPIVSRE